MKRAKGILASLRLVELIHSPRTFPTRSSVFQVSLYSQPSSLFISSLSNKTDYNYDFINTQQKIHFSSKPNPIAELITTKEWSEDLEKELEKSYSTSLNHETVIYVLKNLEKNPQKALDFFDRVTNKYGFKPTLIIYSLMLRILGNKECIDQFWGLIKKMRDDGCDIDVKSYRAVLGNFNGLKMMKEATAWTQFFTKMTKESATHATVKGVVDVLLGMEELGENLKKTVEDLKLNFSEDMILRIVWALYGYPLKALSFFRWLEEHMGYTHNAVTYNGLLRVLAQEESVREFWSMVKEMQTSGHDLDIDSYIKISRQFERSMMLKDSVELYELMMDSPYKPADLNCSLLLMNISTTDAPDIELVNRVVNKYEASGKPFSKTAYDWIYRSLASAGKFEEADKILHAMKDRGFEPDNQTYNHWVFGLCKAGRLDKAIDILDEMESKGFIYDTKTWTFLVREQCEVGKIDQALTCFIKMLDKKFKVDADLLEMLVGVLCDGRRVDNAYTLVTEYVDKINLIPSVTTYKYLTRKLLEERKLKEALNLLRLMKKQNFVPFRAPYVDYISKFGTLDDAREYLKSLSLKRCPSSLVYLQLLQSLIKEGRQSEARDMLEDYPPHIRNHAEILNLSASLKLGNATA